MSGTTTRKMREQLNVFVASVLRKEAQSFDEILVKVQRAHFPATAGWSTWSIDRTVGKWVRAALQRLRKQGRVELATGKGSWRLAEPQRKETP